MKKKESLLSKIPMLSIGTGEQGCSPYEVSKLLNGGKISWAKPISEVILQSQSSLADYQAKFLLEDNYYRQNPLLRNAIKLDDSDKMADLKNLADIDYDLEKYLKRLFCI